MAKRMDSDFILALKREYDLAQVVRADFPDLRDAGGGEWVGKCPLHKDDTPSFRVNKTRYHCFGCSAHGDIISWTILTKGLTFPQAVAALSTHTLPTTTSIKAVREVKNYSDHNAPAILQILRINDDAQEFFVNAEPLADGKAIDYITARIGPGLMASHGIGYAPLDSSHFLTFMAAKGWTDQDLLSSALAAQDSLGRLYARYRDRITIPLYDNAGGIRGFAGRIVPRPETEHLPKYINPPTTHAFNKKRYLYGWQSCLVNGQKRGQVLLVEGYLDAIALHTAGIPTMCIMGTSLSSEQACILEHYFNKVVLLMDGDLPGLEAIPGIFKVLFDKAVDTFACILSDEKDPDEFAYEAPIASLKERILALPRIKLMNLYQGAIVTKEITKQYDRTEFDALLKPYVDDNIKNGWAHYNVVDWACGAYPQYAADIRAALRQMVTNSQCDDRGLYKFRKDDIRAFVKAWMKPCRDVRLKHAGRK